MEAAIFLMAIMGCGEGDAPCREVRLLDARYQSQAACMAETEAALSQFSGIDYPVVVAQCRPASAAAGGLKADEVKLPEPEATPLFTG